MKKLIPSFFGAIVFYTIIPLADFLPLDFKKIARWLPWVGILLGIILGFMTEILTLMDFPPLTKAVLITGFWIFLTGGLHLDGIIDTADGLAVQNPEKRLEVMRDSNSGAFGIMAGIIVILLKITSISEINDYLSFYLIFCASYSRWGQLMAIALYRYLREEGKGAFLKENLNLPTDIILGSLFIIPLLIMQYFWLNQSLTLISFTLVIGITISLLIGWWFKKQLGGHTGDTYGATVEWSEALILCFLTLAK
ncbi:cobalamin synthase [Geminocystis sp. NIES-3708]|uniref:adenosylcobinamide-GDP ribazoletransferase n=1 Tax=Geminocystis sp. NIES-3708 TaxID=1615909 RepID=UPI0005FCD4AB|nr:adenosylcobinamide-GDP ribazoletransferase [Geminocystis sp. NIES-3708]BAQ63054.1 cobalamin synthase [Geminocystis sp. NIES-3708]